ncbi:hypothetical protein Bbelb_236390 [Branchiostoma belcheri]|nr:hypothetical protein Bbelb_236390 [Branchiostoma belcheri]
MARTVTCRVLYYSGYGLAVTRAVATGDGDCSGFVAFGHSTHMRVWEVRTHSTTSGLAPCCSALQNCVSPKGYGNGDGHHPTLCIEWNGTFFSLYRIRFGAFGGWHP